MHVRRSRALHLALSAIAFASVLAVPTARTGAQSAGPTAQAVPNDDVAAYGRGGDDGFHVGLVQSRGGWHARELAVLRPGGSDDAWTGYTCLTGDGSAIVAVVAPRWVSNRPVWHQRGASAFVINTATGAVKPLVAGVALSYHSPGCGIGNTVALARYLGTDYERTEVLVADTATATVSHRLEFPGQLTSAVPYQEGVAGLVGGAVVAATATSPSRTLATVPGRPYMLRPATDGLDLLVADDGPIARVLHVGRGRAAQQVGSGPLTTMRAYLGRNGYTVVVGATERRPGARVRWLQGTAQTPIGASLDGHVSLSVANTDDSTTDHDHHHSGRVGHIQLTDATGVAIEAPTDETPQSSTDEMPPPVGSLPAAQPAGGAAAREGGSGDMASAMTTSSTTPACGVPRNDLRRQVPQPNSAMIDWAIQQATRNQLKGAVLTRPANYANMGLASYQPSNDFVRRELQGWGPGAPVPRSIIEAVFAQESAWKHASRRALPGQSGNPTVGDYYGSKGSLDIIDYSEADCGYGVSQVTDCMSAVATCYTANGKAKVAVDYAENVAAGIQVLVEKWNQIAAAGITLNNGDPQYLENWYFAVWAYNSGFHPFVSSTEPWGLGWTNNPQNADYCPCRHPFLRDSYADAETPKDWPYQERIIGWAETPLKNYKGNNAYPTSMPDGRIVIPPYSSFCDDTLTTGNECSTTHRTGGDGDLDYCKRADRKCWWHRSVTFADCASACETSPFTIPTTATEPENDNNYPPNCNLTAGGDEGDPDPGRSPLIVDEQPSPPLNVEGCSLPNWSSSGSFTATYGTNAAGSPLGVIDWHQLGTGFGGHIYFTKNRAAGDTAHINSAVWAPSGLTPGTYNVRVHVPRAGASTTQARYEVHRGDGTVLPRVINQHLHENRWVSLGTFLLEDDAKVVLSNVTTEAPGTTNVAFDAVAFVPVQGTVVTRTFDAFAVFDENQDINADVAMTPPWAKTTPLESMRDTFEWARGRTVGDTDERGVLQFPVCAITAGATCVKRQTHEVYGRWGARVLAAGDAPRTPQAPDTQARWLALSNADPPQVVDEAWSNNPDNWKIRTRISATYLVNNGVIDPESVYVNVERRTGNSHLPEFVLDIMRAYRDDYGIALPNLTYTARDLLEHTHANTTADPAVNGIAPGRALFGYSPAPTFTSGGACMRVRSIGGGGIGTKPMVHSAAVRAAAQDWVTRVRAAASAGAMPGLLGDVAEDIRKVLFKAANVNPAALDMNSPFWVAPSIWHQADVAFCADGSVKPGNGTAMLDSSYMPDQYLYVDNLPVDQSGRAFAAVPVARGDFQRFSHPPSDYLPTSLTNPWDQCTFDEGNPNYRNRRNGSPWPLSFTTNEDETPNAVRLCDSNYFPPDFHFSN